MGGWVYTAVSADEFGNVTVCVCDVTRLSTVRARAHIHVVLVYRTGAYSVAPAPADDRARSPSDSAAADAGILVGVAIDCCCYYDGRSSSSRLCRFATIDGCVFGEFSPGNSSHYPPRAMTFSGIHVHAFGEREREGVTILFRRHFCHRLYFYPFAFV